MSSNVMENLVNEAKKGNTESFGKLYELYARDMFRFAYFYTSSQATAEDCVSEAVMIAFKKIRQVKKSASFKSWLFKILHNCCAASFRKAEREVAVGDVFAGGEEQTPQDEKLSLKAALCTLPPEEREIIILYYCCGYTSKEIGEIMSLKDATVRSKILRGMEKLKKELL